MSDPAIHDTFTLDYDYAAPPARVFAALADPAQKRRWYAESDGLAGYELDFRVGGAERTESRMSEATPFPGALLTSEAVHLDIVDDARVVIAQTMAMNGRRFSAALLTFEISPGPKGARLRFTHQGAFFEGSDGPQLRAAGWRALLDSLARSLA